MNAHRRTPYHPLLALLLANLAGPMMTAERPVTPTMTGGSVRSFLDWL